MVQQAAAHLVAISRNQDSRTGHRRTLGVGHIVAFFAGRSDPDYFGSFGSLGSFCWSRTLSV
jgi:hypothetical protein